MNCPKCGKEFDVITWETEVFETLYGHVHCNTGYFVCSFTGEEVFVDLNKHLSMVEDICEDFDKIFWEVMEMED